MSFFDNLSYIPKRTAWREDVVYDIEKLWELTNDLIPQKILVNKLIYMLNELLWSDAEGTDLPAPGNDISPMQVMQNPSLSKYHTDMIKEADLSYPILLLITTNGTLDVIDGLHRLSKAYMMRKKYISGVIIPDDILSKAIVPRI